MFYKTQAVVLGVSKYSDSYSIVHTFTRDAGRVSYLLPRSNSKKTKLKTAFFFPFSVLSLEVEHLPLREIQRLKDAERLFPLTDVCTDVNKVALSFFLSEFLTKVLRETHENTLLFDYLKHSIEVLEVSNRGLENFHLAFMFGLTRFLGIYPNLEAYRSGAYFDLMNGEFVFQPPVHKYFLPKNQSVYLCYFRRIHFGNMHLFRLLRTDRNIIIDTFLTYYRLHVCDFPPLKSLDVLRELR